MNDAKMTKPELNDINYDTNWQKDGELVFKLYEKEDKRKGGTYWNNATAINITSETLSDREKQNLVDDLLAFLQFRDELKEKMKEELIFADTDES